MEGSSTTRSPIARAKAPIARSGFTSGIAAKRTHVIERGLYCFLKLGALHVLWRSGVVHRSPVLLDDRRQVVQIVGFDLPHDDQRNRICNAFTSRGAAGKFRCYEPIGGSPQSFFDIVLAERHGL